MTRASSLALWIALLQPAASQMWVAPFDTTCRHVRGYRNADSIATHEMPALRVEGSDLVEDSENRWNISLRIQQYGMVNSYFLDSGNSNVSDIGLCGEGLKTYFPPHWQFTREVLERSEEDSGDCKTMLGEECVDALRSHYKREARRHYMPTGRCPRSGNYSEENPLPDETWNITVPHQCAGLVDGQESWPAGQDTAFAMLREWPLGTSIRSLFESQCNATDNEDSDQFGNNTSLIGGFYGVMDNEIYMRFRIPSFFTFFYNGTEDNNSTTKRDDFQGSPHVEIMCAKPQYDDDFRFGYRFEGDEIFENVKRFNENATTPGENAGVMTRPTLLPILGTTILAAILLA